MYNFVIREHLNIISLSKWHTYKWTLNVFCYLIQNRKVERQISIIINHILKFYKIQLHLNELYNENKLICIWWTRLWNCRKIHLIGLLKVLLLHTFIFDSKSEKETDWEISLFICWFFLISTPWINQKWLLHMPASQFKICIQNTYFRLIVSYMHLRHLKKWEKKNIKKKCLRQIQKS